MKKILILSMIFLLVSVIASADEIILSLYSNQSWAANISVGVKAGETWIIDVNNEHHNIDKEANFILYKGNIKDIKVLVDVENLSYTVFPPYYVRIKIICGDIEYESSNQGMSSKVGFSFTLSKD